MTSAVSSGDAPAPLASKTAAIPTDTTSANFLILIGASHSRRHNVEPEVEGVQQPEKIGQSLAIPFDFDFSSRDLLVKRALAELNRIEGGLGQRKRDISVRELFAFPVIQNTVLNRE
jgi:hypothetical protein